MGLRLVGSCVSVSRIPICPSVFQRSCRPSMKSSRIFEVSILSTGLPTLLNAEEVRAGLTLVLLDRLDPESLPTEEAKLLLPMDPASFQFFYSSGFHLPNAMAC